MKRNLARLVAVGATSVVAMGLAVAAASTASAAVLGSVVMVPLNGSNAATGTMIKTSSACPAGSSAISANIDGPAGSPWVGITLVGGGFPNLAAATTGMIISNSSMDTTATSNSVAVVTGDYTITVDCTAADGVNSSGTFVGTVHLVAGAGANGTGGTFSTVLPAAPASTTSLAVSPASPQNAGVPITLTATVAPSVAGTSTAGTVQFMDGATAIGASVATGAGGVAAVTTSALTAGTHSLTAVFSPTDPAVLAGSTSTATSYVINAAPVNTTTTLASSPAAPTTADVVTLTASLAPASATGTVTFTEGAATVGSASVTGGSASISLTGLTAGTHTYAASFAGTGVYQNSSATAITVNVTAFAGVSTSETVITTIPAGTLTISAAATPVNMGTAALNATNTLFVAGPTPLNNVTITDTRAGSLGWGCNGQVGNFTGAIAGPTHVINGENLGWAPKTVTIPATMTVSAGPAVAPALGVSIADAGTQGLKSSRELASSPIGSSIGTAIVGADLNLNAPTTTPADVYTATLTLTAL